MKAFLVHDFVICTKNRPRAMEQVLSSIAGQTRAPANVVVVDASDDATTRHVVTDWTEKCRGLQVTYLEGPADLPIQRNIALRTSSADVVHFVDDDVVLDSSYLERLARVFEQDEGCEIVGAGGLITNQARRRPRIWWRAAGLDSRRGGTVLLSGANIVVTDAPTRVSVDWLSGCSMSYRRSVAAHARFDESLRGYALMEDVDFSFRMGKLGKLVVEPQAKLVHVLADESRWDHRSGQRAKVYRRGWFVKKNLPRRAVCAFWWSVIAGVVVQIVSSLLKRHRFGLRVAAWQLEGTVDYLRGRR